MIEPPGDLGRTGILEIDNRVLIAIELALVEQCTSAVHESGELELGIAADAFGVEARE
jgi:hypothetical protein